MITTFLGVGIMGLSSAPLGMDRVHLVNLGQPVTVGDCQLTAVKPPVFDNPITARFVDDRPGILFGSDCFSGLLTEVPENAADIDTEQLQAGEIRWAAIDSPWILGIDRDVFGHSLEQIRSLAPSMVCSSHVPPAPGRDVGRLPGVVEQDPRRRSIRGSRPGRPRSDARRDGRHPAGGLTRQPGRLRVMARS